jgi:putative transposase
LKKNLPSAARERKQLVDPHSSIPLIRQAELLGISRASIYKPSAPVSCERLALLHAVDTIYTAHPYYGTRRVRVTLLRDYAMEAGRDAVRSAMQTLGLQAIYPKKGTSVPHPNHTIYPYLLHNVTASRPNHIWGTDITYIRLQKGFCYLCAIIDWHSRKVLSWNVSDTMEQTLCIETLEDALSVAIPEIHNSDQGSQFTSEAYLSTLKGYQSIRISMDGRGRCMDNIFTERLWRTVKYEDVYLKGYQTIHDVRGGLANYFDFYNNHRPHQSLNYKTPSEIYSFIN